MKFRRFTAFLEIDIYYNNRSGKGNFRLGFPAKRKIVSRKKNFSRPFCFIFAFRSLAKNAKIFASICFAFSHFAFRENIFAKFCISHFREKVCEMRPIIFAFFREMFRSLETLLQIGIQTCSHFPGFENCYNYSTIAVVGTRTFLVKLTSRILRFLKSFGVFKSGLQNEHYAF